MWDLLNGDIQRYIYSRWMCDHEWIEFQLVVWHPEAYRIMQKVSDKCLANQHNPRAIYRLRHGLDKLVNLFAASASPRLAILRQQRVTLNTDLRKTLPSDYDYSGNLYGLWYPRTLESELALSMFALVQFERYSPLLYACCNAAHVNTTLHSYDALENVLPFLEKRPPSQTLLIEETQLHPYRPRRIPSNVAFVEIYSKDFDSECGDLLEDEQYVKVDAYWITHEMSFPAYPHDGVRELHWRSFTDKYRELRLDWLPSLRNLTLEATVTNVIWPTCESQLETLIVGLDDDLIWNANSDSHFAGIETTPTSQIPSLTRLHMYGWSPDSMTPMVQCVRLQAPVLEVWSLNLLGETGNTFLRELQASSEPLTFDRLHTLTVYGSTRDSMVWLLSRMPAVTQVYSYHSEWTSAYVPTGVFPAVNFHCKS